MIAHYILSIFIVAFAGLSNTKMAHSAQTRTVSAGLHHVCSLTNEGRPYCWGDEKMKVAYVLTDLTFSELSSGGYHTCGLTTEGRAVCWGYGNNGQLGAGRREFRSPLSLVSADFSFSQISAGTNFTCGLTPEGRAYCWGSNYYGQLGIGEEDDDRLVPTPVAGNLLFSEISAGGGHTCGITFTGQAYCWGFGLYGELGNGKDGKNYHYSPSPVVGGLRFSKISAGMWHTCGLSVEGRAYCWGGGDITQKDSKNGNAPALISHEVLFSQISVGTHSNCGLTEGGHAYCWGRGNYGQLGNGDRENRSSPTLVSGHLRFSQISAGSEYACGLSEEGSVYCWGDNHFYQLGTGDSQSRSIPTLAFEPDRMEQEVTAKIAREKNRKLNPKFLGSDQAQLVDLFIQRSKANQWMSAYVEGDSTVNIESIPPRVLRDPLTLIYRITRPEFSNELGLIPNTDYRISDLSTHQRSRIEEELFDLPPYPFTSHQSNLINPEFDPIDLTLEEQKEIEVLEIAIRERMKELPTPNPDHLGHDVYYDHRVGVHGNTYDQQTFINILSAMKWAEEENFVEEMARLGTSFPKEHAEAKNGLIYTFAHLYVTGKFPSPGIKNTYYHFLLRCGQIH